MTGAYLEVYSIYEFSGSRVKFVVCQCLILVLYCDGACKDLSGINICV